MRHAYLDLDEVVVDLMGPLARAHGKVFDRANWPSDYDLSRTLGRSHDDIWGHPDVRGSEFWATLPKQSWADDLVGILKDQFPGELSFLSKAARDPWSAAGKLRWVAEHYPDVPVLVGTEKVQVAAPGFVLIDDYEVNVDAWQKAGGAAVLFPAPWNRFRGHADPVGLVERVLRERRREMEMI